MRLILKLVLAIALVYGIGIGLFFAAMYQPPETFAAIVAKMPQQLSPLVPFRPMWMVARSGQLQPGDRAPEFELTTQDKESVVRLSDLNLGRPVVLVFGSYT